MDGGKPPVESGQGAGGGKAVRAILEIRQGTDGRDVFGRTLTNGFELLRGLVHLIELDQGTSERDLADR